MKELVHISNNEPNPKTEETDLCQDKDIIPDPDTMIQDMTIGRDMTDSNLLVEDEKNWADVINHKHNQDPHILLPSYALAAHVIVVKRTKRH